MSEGWTTFWLALLLSVPIGLVVNVLTPLLQRAWRRRTERGRERALQQETTDRLLATWLTENPAAAQTIMTTLQVRTALYMLFAVVFLLLSGMGEVLVVLGTGAEKSTWVIVTSCALLAVSLFPVSLSARTASEALRMRRLWFGGSGWPDVPIASPVDWRRLERSA